MTGNDHPTGSPPRGLGMLSLVLAMSMGVGPLLSYGMAATAPLIIADLDLSRTAFGALATLSFATGAAGSGLLGGRIDNLTERFVLVILFWSGGLALLMAALAPSYAWLCAAVLVSGIAQALSNPVTNRLIGAHARPGSRGVLMGVKQSGVQMAQFGAGISLPWLALLVGWRGSLAILSTFAVIGLALTMRHIPVRERPKRSDRTRPPSEMPRAVWWLTGYALLTGAGMQAANVYLPLFAFEGLDLSPTVAGSTVGVLGGIGLVTRILWGRAADRMARPERSLVWLSTAAAFGGLLMLAAGISHNPWPMWLGAAIFGASAIPANVVMMLVVLGITPPHLVGRVSGFLATGLFTGFGIGPVLFGLLVDVTSTYLVGWAGVLTTHLLASVLMVLWRWSEKGGVPHAPDQAGLRP